MLLALSSCSKSSKVEKDKDVFIFTAYDNLTGVWTIERNNIYEKTKTEIKAICAFYHAEPNVEINKGKNSCDKNVGSRISLHLSPPKSL